MKNKIKKITTLLLCAVVAFSTITTSADYLYAEDGRVKWFEPAQVPAQLTVGWYKEPVQRLYAEDGRSKVFPKSQVAAQLTVGWYECPVQRLYAPGKSKVFPKSQVAAQLTVGWYTKPVAAPTPQQITTPSGYTKMYALDGRSKYVLNSQVTANELVGWYTEADYNLIKQGYWKQSVNLYDINTINSSGYSSMTPSKNGGITNIGTSINGSSLEGRYEGSYIEYYLGGKYTDLTGTFYLSTHHGSIPFQMYYTFIADGKTIYRTPTFNTNSYPLNFKVNVKGCTKLRIESHFDGSKSVNDYYRLGNLKLYKWVK